MRNITPVPNIFFDKHLPNLTESELKLLLVIIRQTYGWYNPKTKSRKTRDRISHSQFITKTGLSRRIISKTVNSLVAKGLIQVYSQYGNILNSGHERKGQFNLSYSPTCALNDTDMCTLRHQPVQKGAYNKRNYTKANETKERVDQVGFSRAIPIQELLEIYRVDQKRCL